MATEIWVNIGSGNGLLPDGTKPLPEPMLTDPWWSPVTFILGQFHKRCLNHQSLKISFKLTCLKLHSNVPGANELIWMWKWCVMCSHKRLSSAHFGTLPDLGLGWVQNHIKVSNWQARCEVQTVSHAIEHFKGYTGVLLRKWDYGWVITSHSFPWMQLFINVLNSMLV